MRLNFAGVPDADIREGIRRIGRVLAQQVRLLGTLSGSLKGARGSVQESDREPAATGGHEPAGEETAVEDAPLADVVALPRRPQEGPVRRRRDR